MKNHYHRAGLYGCLLLAAIFLFGCNQKGKQTAPPPEISVVEVQQEDVTVYKNFVGQIYGYSDIPIRARVTGFLKGIYFDEGSKVSKGKLLYKIDPEQFESKVATQQSLLAEAQTQLAKAKSDLDRIVPLAKINAVSKSDLDAAQANYDAALAYVDAMRSNLRFAEINLGYCTIRSPLDGVIGKTNARVGEFVGQNPNPVILNTVSTIDTVRVEFYLAEADYLRLAREIKKDTLIRKQENKRVLKLLLADGSTFKHQGYFNFINREVDPQTGSLLVQATFPNPERLLRPGQYAKVVVPFNVVKNALVIPQRCLIELQGQFSVYLVNSENKVENRQITVGDKFGNMVLVTDGLNVNDKIVIDALQKVRSGMAIVPNEIVFESKTNQQIQ